MQLVSLMYVCEAKESLTTFELEKIITSGNKENLSANVTSFMVLIDEVIIQIIEGEESKVEETYAKMKNNIHLCNFSLVFRKNIIKRTFDRWSLGYHIVRNEDISSLDEFKGMDKKGFFDKLRSDLESFSQQILYHFYRQKADELM